MSKMTFALGVQPDMAGPPAYPSVLDAAKGKIPELAPKYPTLETLVAADADLFLAGWYYGMMPGEEVTPDTLKAKGIETDALSESCEQVDKARPREDGNRDGACISEATKRIEEI